MILDYFRLFQSQSHSSEGLSTVSGMQIAKPNRGLSQIKFLGNSTSCDVEDKTALSEGTASTRRSAVLRSVVLVVTLCLLTNLTTDGALKF